PGAIDTTDQRHPAARLERTMAGERPALRAVHVQPDRLAAWAGTRAVLRLQEAAAPVAEPPADRELHALDLALHRERVRGRGAPAAAVGRHAGHHETVVRPAQHAAAEA